MRIQKPSNYVVLQMKASLYLPEDQRCMTVELYPEKAPITVANFQKLVTDGFFKGLSFHRVVPGFVIQGGDPLGDCTGGPGYTIKGEFQSNGVANDLKHVRGVVSMARDSDPDSAGSQFFIMIEPSPRLDGEYAAFGKVVRGEAVIDRIVEAFEKTERTSPDHLSIMEDVYFTDRP